jgi:hypothetical protein
VNTNTDLPAVGDHDEARPITGTWRRHGDCIYHLAMYEVPIASVGRWYARLASTGRLEPARGAQPVAIALTLPDAYGAGPDDPSARLDAATNAWVKAQTLADPAMRDPPLQW